MNNRIKNVVNKINMKSDMENRIIANCKAETRESLVQHSNKGKALIATRWKMVVTAAACCAIILLSFIAFPNLINNKIGVKPSDESSRYTAEKTAPVTSVSYETRANEVMPTTTRSKKDNSSATTTKNETHPTENKPSVQASIRALGDFIPMTLDELCEYYGRKIVPASLPKDLILQKSDYHGICKRNDKTPGYDDLQSTFYKDLVKDGDIYFDDNTVIYRSQINDRALTIGIAKDRFPFNSIGDPTRFSKITVSGIEVRMAHYNDAPYSNSDMYTALVMVDHAGYYLFSNNLTKDEFMSVLTSII